MNEIYEHAVFLFTHKGDSVVRHANGAYELVGAYSNIIATFYAHGMADQLAVAHHNLVEDVGDILTPGWQTRVQTHPQFIAIVKLRWYLNVMELNDEEFDRIMNVPFVVAIKPNALTAHNTGRLLQSVINTI